MKSGGLVALLAVVALVVVGGLWAVLRGARPVPQEPLVEPRDELVAQADESPALPPAPVAGVTSEEREELGAAGPDAAPVPRDAVWIEGRVLFPAGTPLEAELAVIAHGKAFGGGREGTREHRAPVAADGSFRAAVEESTRTARFELESRWLYLPKRVSLRLKGAEEELVLEPELGGVLAGTITPPRALVADPRAFEGVQVVAYLAVPNSEVSVHEVTTPDAEGRFELAPLPPGAHYTVQVLGERYLDLEQTRVEVRPGARTTLDLALELGLELAGRVVDERGVGVAEATLVTTTRRGESTLDTSYHGEVTGAEGGFRLQGLEAGDIGLRASKPGYLESALELGELRLGELHAGLELVLREGLALQGVVLWPDGRPARGARVAVEQASDEQKWLPFGDDDRSVRADDGGAFRVTGLVPGACTLTAHLAPQGDGDAPEWFVQMDDVPAGASELALVLGAGAVIAGRVVDDLGAPLDDFRVFTSEGGGSNRALFPESRSERFRGAAGAFELSGLEPGDWDLRVTAKGHADSGPQRVTTPYEGAELEFVLARTGEIEGHVVDPAGGGLHRARVTVGEDGPGARTKSDGSFHLRRVPPGQLVLRASHDEHGDSEPLPLELAPGESRAGVTLVVRVAASLAITLHPDAGPPAGREVVVWCRADGAREPVFTDEAGRVVVEGLTPGSYQLTLEPEADGELEGADLWLTRRARQRVATVELAPGERAQVVLGESPERAIRVDGRVVEAGRVVADALVAFVPRAEGSADGALARTDDAGRFELALAAPGSWFAEVAAPGTDPVRLAVEVPDTPEHALELELPSGAIRGRVRGPDGRPATGCSIVLLPARASAALPDWTQLRQAETDEAGRFELSRVSPGTYDLTAGGELPWQFSRRREPYGLRRVEGIVVGEGEVLEGLELDLGRPAKLIGTVLGPDGAPIVGARLAIEWPSGGSISPWPSWVSDAGGRFLAEGLPAGRLRVSARHGELSCEPRDVDLRAGEATTLELVLNH